jgi:hypothetical protein
MEINMGQENFKESTVRSIWDEKTDYKPFGFEKEYIEATSSKIDKDINIVSRSQCRTTHKRKDC